jgi:hypothetical protein
MFYDADFTTISMIAFGITIFFTLIILVWKKDSGVDPLSSAIFRMKISLIGFGVLVVFMMLSMPSTPVLNSFGYPTSVEDIQNQEKLLYYLQEFNKAIVRIDEVVRFFLNLFVGWFLVSLYLFFDVLRTRNTLSKDA